MQYMQMYVKYNVIGILFEKLQGKSQKLEKLQFFFNLRFFNV